MEKNAKGEKSKICIAVAQCNPVVGDISGNLRLAKQALVKAAAAKADILLFSELFLSGYPAEDLVLKPAFLQACMAALRDLTQEAGMTDIVVIIGLPLIRSGKIYNAVTVLHKGKIIAERHKTDLPNYDEFDEKRVFSGGKGRFATTEPIKLHDWVFALPLCEDIWNDDDFCKKMAEKKAEFILAANASPYERGKPARRLRIAAAQAKSSGLPLIYANQFGGQDELIFDGGSFAVDGSGHLVGQAKHFAEDIFITVWEKESDKKSAFWQCIQGEQQPVLQGEEADYTACMLALRDYAHKSGFKKAVLGLSGGIDSALCAVMAVDALGKENVQTIQLPYHYTAGDSLNDARQCAENLGCAYRILPIAAAVESCGEILAPFLEGGRDFKNLRAAMDNDEESLWVENLQSRLRGVFLMAVSNKSGAMLITTGNKSEIAVGFSTLYGDMNGGFNPIKDIYKMQVYALSCWRNAHKPKYVENAVLKPIPQNIIDKAPSAELRAEQRDEDRLPPYPVLDVILQAFIEKEQDCAALIAAGYAKDVVERVEYLLYIAEYKRRQSAPGVKISSKAFGRVRRYPIVNRFRTASVPHSH